ncbi:hypothetical protein [Natronococcus occultus]|uniref:hypothetical protein n=1 Tax=Natronococcus occultus TaxID=29288 RepID=UPI0006782A0F|nr:hypothetical protein [Natronococcus occultus]
MDRRTLLAGTGTVLATTVAGCGSLETDSEDDADDGTADAVENGMDDEAVDDELPEVDDEDDEPDSEERIPGFDAEAFDIDNEELTVEEIDHDDETVTVRMAANTLDQEALEDELAEAGGEFVNAIDDTEEFAETVSTVEWDVQHGGSELATFYIESEWIVAYDEGELSESELLDRIAATVSVL